MSEISDESRKISNEELEDVSGGLYGSESYNQTGPCPKCGRDMVRKSSRLSGSYLCCPECGYSTQRIR